MGGVTPASLAPILLVLGDEELLATRAVTEAVAKVRGVDPEADVREYQASALTVGEIAEMLSPSLFGGRRVLVLRSGQDARKDLVAALLAYAKNPDPDVQLLVLHLGGAKGKAFADGLRAAGATVVPAAKLKGHRDRVAFVRDEIRRAGGKCTDDAAEALLAAVGNDLRELAAACSQLVADTDGRISADDGRPLLPGPGRGERLHRGRRRHGRRRAGGAGGAALGPARRGRPGAHRRRPGRRGTHGRPGGRRPAGATRTSSPAPSACPPGRSSGRSGRARGWTPEGLVRAMQVAAECNAAVKGGSDDRAYALERAVFSVAAARQGSAR